MPSQELELIVISPRTERVHLSDAMKARIGVIMAEKLGEVMRREANADEADLLCPGCYMIAICEMALELARQNGQDPLDLGATLGSTFLALGFGGNAFAAR